MRWSVEAAFCRIPPGKDIARDVLPARLLTLTERRVGIAPGGEWRVVGAGALRKKFQTSAPVEDAALGEAAVSGMRPKRGEVFSRESTAVEDNQRMHVAVGRVVIVNGGNELNRLPIALFEFEHRGTGEGA